MKIRENYFDLDALEAALFWDEFEIKYSHIAVVAVAIPALILACALLELERFAAFSTASLGAFAGIVILGLAARWLNHRWAQSSTVAFGPESFSGPSAHHFRRRKFRWQEVHTLAHVHAILGRSASPTDRNLLIFSKDWRLRISLPILNQHDQELLFELLDRLSQKHGFELLFDHSDEGNRKIQQLPWI